MTRISSAKALIGRYFVVGHCAHDRDGVLWSQYDFGAINPACAR
jgi:hypothetical protein